MLDASFQLFSGGGGGGGRRKEGARDGGRSEERRWTRRRRVEGGGRAKHAHAHAHTHARTHPYSCTHARAHTHTHTHTHTIGVGTKGREEADSFGFQHCKWSLYDNHRTDSKARSFKRCIKHKFKVPNRILQNKFRLSDQKFTCDYAIALFKNFYTFLY